MATDTRTAAPTQATDANFRLWITAVKNSLVAAGLTQVADTGVVNYTTVTRPLSASAIQGFDIFRFSDSLQATKPVYMKVEYGAGGASTNPLLTVSFGTGTNGSGTLTGPVFGPNAGKAQLTAGTTVRNMLSAGVAAGGWFNFCLWPGLADAASAGAALVMCVERTRDVNGDPTGDGLYVYLSNADFNYGGGGFIDFTTDTAYNVYNVCPWNGATGIVGADTYLSPFFPPGLGAPGKFFPPALFGLSYLTADITRNTDISVSMYGSSHTFKCMGTWVDKVAMNVSTGTWSAALAMRWE